MFPDVPILLTSYYGIHPAKGRFKVKIAVLDIRGQKGFRRLELDPPETRLIEPEERPRKSTEGLPHCRLP